MEWGSPAVDQSARVFWRERRNKRLCAQVRRQTVGMGNDVFRQPPAVSRGCVHSSTTPRTARATSAPASHARCEHLGDVRGGHSWISRRERARASRGVSQGGVSRRGNGRLRICVSHKSSSRGGVAPARVSVPRAPRTGRVRPGDAGRRRRLPRRARGRFHPGASHARAHAFGSSDASAANFNPLHIRPIPADLTDASRALPLPRSTYRVRSARSSTITPSKSTPP